MGACLLDEISLVKLKKMAVDKIAHSKFDNMLLTKW